MVLDLLSSSIDLLSGYLGSGSGPAFGSPKKGPARDGSMGRFGFFSEHGSFGARQEVGVYGGLGPL